jgi:hypothetical protein
MELFAFYAPEIEDWGAYFFCPVCHSVTVILSLSSAKNLNLGYNFRIVSARALIFYMSIPCDKTFPCVPKNFYLVTLTLVLEVLFNFDYIFWLVGTRVWYCTWLFLVTRPFRGYKKYDLVTFTFVFDLLIKNFNLGYNFWIVSTRALIFHMSSLWQDLYMGTKCLTFCVWPTYWKF